jgi:lipopolysaccharide/colanic/teichoic acid biosynthesis glycosyltransferase
MDECDQRNAVAETLFRLPWAVAPGANESEPPEESNRVRYQHVKRLLDIVVASTVLLALSPLWLVIAILIKIDSKGPVFFRQERVGFDFARGCTRNFKMYKFRTMGHRSDESVHRAYVAELIRSNGGPSGANSHGSVKMAQDRRVTRVGKLLRKSSLDELPQLLNVLKGDMSLVGPRPALPYEVDLYQEWHKCRLEAVPGMTGWWQVMGRNRVTFEDMVCMDAYYIRHACLSFDLGILFRTPMAVLSGRGAG